jgi:uncharacterized membrane protein YczE
VSNAREIPATPWSATGSRWSLRPRTVAVLVAGLWVFATGEAMLVAAALGNSPWTVLAQGISLHSPLTIGQGTLAISAVIMLLWIPLRERVGFGTVANAVVIAIGLDVMLAVLPTPAGFAWQLLQVLIGVAILSVGAAVYLTANLGPGPRDGLMTGLHRRYGWRIAIVRTGLEVTALALGWLLGGRVGIGTVVFALGVGPALGLVLLGMRRVYGRSIPAS